MLLFWNSTKYAGLKSKSPLEYSSFSKFVSGKYLYEEESHKFYQYFLEKF